MRRLALFSVFCATSAATAVAGVTVSAELSAKQVALGDQLTLSVTVSGDQASLPSPKLPAIDAFNVYDAGNSQSLNFINGRVSASVTSTYVLTPRSVGKFRIPPISTDGATPTSPLDIEVVRTGSSTPPSAAPTTAFSPRRERRGSSPSADVFVTAFLDRSHAYVNQQVTLTIRFLNAVQLIGNVQYVPPEMTGFLSEDLPPERNGMTQINGRPYHFSEIKVALFPIQPGRLRIGPTQIRCQTMRTAENTQDFFDRFFAMAAPQPLTVNSEPLTLEVDPLPPGKPMDFTGVVGRLAARASVDRTELKAGDAATLTVVVSGTGNLKSLPEPKKPDLPSLRFFETENSVAIDKKNDRIGGSKTFRTVAVPRASGEVRVPKFSFSYFDPGRKTYSRVETSSLTLRVRPGAPAATSIATTTPPSAPGLTAIADDIRYLKIMSAKMTFSSGLAAFAGLGHWHALPFAVFLIAGMIAWRRRAAQADPRGRRRREALTRAQTRLKVAASLSASGPAGTATLCGEALVGFIADKLDAPTAGLTLKAALDGLKSSPKPPSEQTLARLSAAWQEADLRRFAPGAAAGNASQFVTEISALLKTLDQEFRP